MDNSGSLIVDGLSSYKAPVFVYIVPNGELRGGAWVVLDPTINANGMMEMYVVSLLLWLSKFRYCFDRYADNTARAGVLEPEGVVEIKLKKDKIKALMSQNDVAYNRLEKESKNQTLSVAERQEKSEALEARADFLIPIFTQIANHFADLHDGAIRMKAKGVIREALDWSSSRNFFYQRLRRRLVEEDLLSQITAADPTLDRNERLYILSQFVPPIKVNKEGVSVVPTDEMVYQTLEQSKSEFSQKLVQIIRTRNAKSIAAMVQADTQGFEESFQTAIQLMASDPTKLAMLENCLRHLSK